MKERTISNCEKNFILNAALDNKRLDGRCLQDHRDFDIVFGADYGSCIVSLGETKVVSQVLYEIEEPKQNKPNEGLLFINVDVGGIAAPHFETGKQNNISMRLSRMLEKGIKESGCVDLEALCIVAEEKVWVLRLEILVLNHDGGLFTCCSMAALASLLNTRLPQVTLEDDNIIVHSTKELTPHPLSVNHFPVAITFSLIHDGELYLADPTELEERIQESELIYYMNSFRELCGIHFGGKPVKNKKILMQCANQAAFYAEKFAKEIRKLLEEDSASRDKLMSKIPGFVDCINLDRVLTASQDRTAVKVILKERVESDEGEVLSGDEDTEMTQVETLKSDPEGTAILPSTTTAFGKDWVPSGGKSSWSQESSSEDEEGECEETDSESEEDVEVVKIITEKDRIIDKIELSGDSEEEETSTLYGKDLENT